MKKSILLVAFILSGVFAYSASYSGNKYYSSSFSQTLKSNIVIGANQDFIIGVDNSNPYGSSVGRIDLIQVYGGYLHEYKEDYNSRDGQYEYYDHITYSWGVYKLTGGVSNVSGSGYVEWIFYTY